jgi:hypothetical protein
MYRLSLSHFFKVNSIKFFPKLTSLYIGVRETVVFDRAERRYAKATKLCRNMVPMVWILPGKD